MDLHGTMSIAYEVTITKNDLNIIINQVKQDSINKWVETDIGDQVTSIYPENPRDTVFYIGIMTSRSIITINMRQGF